jgi:predicted kinase
MLNKVLIVINGLPATGKTTLGRQIADRFGIPIFSKDDFKETIFDRLGWSDREWSKKVGSAAIGVQFIVAESCLRVGQSCIVENFFRRVTVDNFGETFTEMCSRHGFRMVQVLVKADGDEVCRRFERRARHGPRHPGHSDLETLGEIRPILQQGRNEPLDLPGELVEVDTTDFSAVDIDDLLQRILDAAAAGPEVS